MLPENAQTIEIGKGRVVKEGSDIAFICYGARIRECMAAADILAEKDFCNRCRRPFCKAA